jgi:hypothetical protein
MAQRGGYKAAAMARRQPGGHSGTKKILQKKNLLQTEISCKPVFVVYKILQMQNSWFKNKISEIKNLGASRKAAPACHRALI